MHDCTEDDFIKDTFEYEFYHKNRWNTTSFICSPLDNDHINLLGDYNSFILN